MSIDATETEESLPDPDSMNDMSETEELHSRELEGQPGTAEGREPEREPGAAVDGEMDREVSIVLGGQLEEKKVIFKVWSCVWGCQGLQV